MTNTVYNFSAGPAGLPKAVMLRVQSEFVNYQDSGVSIIECSHRSPAFSEILANAQANIRELMSIPDSYEVLFVHGGATMQFAMLPMNLLPEGGSADYIDSGRWSQRAITEATLFGDINVAASGKEDNYTSIPKVKDWKLNINAAFIHYTSNNTVYGTQFHEVPALKRLVVDMSSDILSAEIEVNKFDLIYAGLQKNLGPSAVALVIIKKELLKQNLRPMPSLMNYATLASNNSMFNTPNTFAIYLFSLVTQWVKDQGGVSAMEKVNHEKAALLYQTIDQSNGFYSGLAKVEDRSLMNVCFTLPTTELTEQFIAQATARSLVALAGHRSVGGIRASIYNAMPLEGVKKLADFMDFFQSNSTF